MARRAYSCGIDAALDVIGGKWKFLILWNLANQTYRFGELRRRVPGVSEKMLIQSLKEMVTDGVVSRQDFQEVPPHVTYSLTDFGRSLAEAAKPLCEWGTAHMACISGLPERAPATTLLVSSSRS